MAKRTVTHQVSVEIDDEDLGSIIGISLCHVPEQRDQDDEIQRTEDLQIAYHTGGPDVLVVYATEFANDLLADLKAGLAAAEPRRARVAAGKRP